MKQYKLFLLSLLSSILLGYTLNYINSYFGQSDSIDQFKDMEYIHKLLLICLWGPLLETLFFQSLPFYLLHKFITKNKYYIIFTLSIFFAIMHISSLLNFSFGLLGGVVLGNFYYQSFVSKSTLNAFFFTFLLHALYNSYGFFILKI